MWNLILAQAQQAVPAPAAPGTQGLPAAGGQAPPASGLSGSPWGSLLPMLIAFIAIMYFLMIRPQQKREKERRAMLGALAKGDKVVTSGGICGTVVGLSENHVVLKVDDDVKIEFVRSAVAQVISR